MPSIFFKKLSSGFDSLIAGSNDKPCNLLQALNGLRGKHEPGKKITITAFQPQSKSASAKVARKTKTKISTHNGMCGLFQVSKTKNLFQPTILGNEVSFDRFLPSIGHLLGVFQCYSHYPFHQIVFKQHYQPRGFLWLPMFMKPYIGQHLHVSNIQLLSCNGHCQTKGKF